MPYTDLLRITVLLTGAEATALAAITAIATNRDADTTTIVVAAAWWLIALTVGFYLGRPAERPTASATPSPAPAPRPRSPPSRPRESRSAGSGLSA